LAFGLTGVRLLWTLVHDEESGATAAVKLGEAGACRLVSQVMGSHDYAFREAVPQELCLGIIEGTSLTSCLSPVGTDFD
jgi:hypothetical protein